MTTATAIKLGWHHKALRFCVWSRTGKIGAFDLTLARPNCGRQRHASSGIRCESPEPRVPGPASRRLFVNHCRRDSLCPLLPFAVLCGSLLALGGRRGTRAGGRADRTPNGSAQGQHPAGLVASCSPQNSMSLTTASPICPSVFASLCLLFGPAEKKTMPMLHAS